MIEFIIRDGGLKPEFVNKVDKLINKLNNNSILLMKDEFCASNIQHLNTL